MPTFEEVVADHTDLGKAAVERLRQLMSEWAILADLSFSDLVLWVPDQDPNVMWAAAQVRPNTGPTTMIEDVVGDLIAYAPEHLVSSAYMSGERTRTSRNKLLAGLPVDVEAIPVPFQGKPIGVVELHLNQYTVRRPGVLEEAYLETAEQLLTMMTTGAFPVPGLGPTTTTTPRVGDGIMRLDFDGNVVYASPNAVSCLRRLGVPGELQEENLGGLIDELVGPGPARHRAWESVLSGKTAETTEIVANTVHLTVRVLPLSGADGKRTGGLVLCRDVTDVRSRERELVTKDATIREIHHRVKNNLQTVSALLRMQARRIESPEGKLALQTARARVTSIAVVHETLSRVYGEDVEFDQIADKLIAMVADVAAPDASVTVQRQGTFATVPGAGATNLALILTEVCQNAIEHGLVEGTGSLWVRPRRDASGLIVEVVDDGVGLPEGFDLASSRSSLGLSIVRALVSDLRGSFTIGPRESGERGTRALIRFPAGSPVAPLQAQPVQAPPRAGRVEEAAGSA